jgi:peptidoglycan/LPS O-acetylase OafA/YrhL
MVPHWVYDLAVLVAILVLPLALWIWSLLERWAERRRARQVEREIEEDALDLRMAVGLVCADRDGLLEPRRQRPPEDIQ